MEEEEHEVCGADIPDVAEMEPDADVDMLGDAAANELDEMNKIEGDGRGSAGRSVKCKPKLRMRWVLFKGAAAAHANKEEDARSVFVGNVSCCDGQRAIERLMHHLF
ncbi:polyadenylate-binding protein 2-like isoform X1 [Salvia divinorum]|uniref:Polyadenylate-binding protein 2-like isoform X1 n=1 Tax=Salvia divinorum TaxID=28513 RepID=A0ABD1G9K3_SALDI